MLSGTMPASAVASMGGRAKSNARSKKASSVKREPTPDGPVSSTSLPTFQPFLPPPPSFQPLKPTAAATPSLSAIVAAYKKDGKGDRDLLVALLDAKRKEDECSAARDQLRAEELRAQSLQYYAYLVASAASAYPLPGAPTPTPVAPTSPSGRAKPELSADEAASRRRSASIQSSASSTHPCYIPASFPYPTLVPASASATDEPLGSKSGHKRRRSSDESTSSSTASFRPPTSRRPVSREEAMSALREKILRDEASASSDQDRAAKKARSSSVARPAASGESTSGGSLNSTSTVKPEDEEDERDMLLPDEPAALCSSPRSAVLAVPQGGSNMAALLDVVELERRREGL